MKLEKYADVVAYLSGKKRTAHLLLGNGFSMAYDPGIFSYNALYDFVQKTENELLSKLFEIVNTKNFELVMQQLDNFSELLEVFGSDDTLKARVAEASSQLKRSLIDAVKSLHPSHVFTIPDNKSRACSAFLTPFIENGGQIFTTNYDILLYWVLMRNEIENAVDGFGRERLNDDEYVPEEEVEYSELRWGKHKDSQNIHYLHGALPIFDTGVEIEKEQYTSENYLLRNIEERLEKKEYPIFVTAGTPREKLTHIMHNRYLVFCYEQLTQLVGSLITFGFNFGLYDEHIIEAINIAAKHGKRAGDKLFSVYIGVYSDADRRHIESIEDKFKCKVHIFDAKTANVWQDSKT